MPSIAYLINPIAKPRMTNADRRIPRPAVTRYWTFKAQIQALEVEILPECHIQFYVEMPKSWSKKKRLEHFGKPHQQTPDIDNLIKALFDAVLVDDKHIWSISATKMWADQGSIVIDTWDDRGLIVDVEA